MAILKLIKYIRDPQISWYRKILFLLPVLYFFSPITLIPYILFPVAGWLDNIIVTGILIYYLKRVLKKYDPGVSNKKNEEDVIDLKKDDYELK